MRDFLRFALLSCAAGLLGCASTVIDESSHYTLEFVQTGGFAGVHQTTTIDNQTKVISFSSGHGAAQKADLDDAEITALDQALNSADIPSAGGPYHCTACGDQFTDKAHLVIDGAASEAQWDDDPSSPAGLIALSREMSTLVIQKFSNEP